jgi:hypothetical protein
MGKGGAGFRSKDLHGGLEFKGLTKQAAVVVKRHMKKRHAEQAGTKSSVDQGSLEFTEEGVPGSLQAAVHGGPGVRVAEAED